MLVLSIWNAQKEQDEQESRIVHAAVHAWYEGHIHAHVEVGRKVEIEPPRDDFPPPFPAGDDEAFWEVVDATKAKPFTSLDASLAFAAALAWEGGYRRGKDCPGCHAFGTRDAEYSAKLRQGGVRITIGAPPMGSTFASEGTKG